MALHNFFGLPDLPTPEADCFYGVRFAIYVGGVIDEAFKEQLTKDIVAAGGVVTEDFGEYVTLQLYLCIYT
jgi:hypothetical protein